MSALQSVNQSIARVESALRTAKRKRQIKEITRLTRKLAALKSRKNKIVSQTKTLKKTKTKTLTRSGSKTLTTSKKKKKKKDDKWEPGSWLRDQADASRERREGRQERRQARRGKAVDWVKDTAVKGHERRQARRGKIVDWVKGAASGSMSKIDKFYGVQLTRANADRARLFYTALLLTPMLPPSMKLYALSRLKLAKKLSKGTGGGGSDSKAKVLTKASNRMRDQAAMAAQRRDYATSTRLSDRAEILERQARSAEASAYEEGPAYRASMVEGAGNSYRSRIDDDADVDADSYDDTPWYKRPIVWAIAGVLGVGGVIIARSRKGGKKKGGGGKARRRPSKKVFVATGRGGFTSV